MLRVLIAAALLTSPAAVSAQAGYARVEQVFELAKRVCALNDASLIMPAANRAGLNYVEKVLLINYCLMHSQGALQALREIKVH